jgi:hypothetical protein
MAEPGLRLTVTKRGVEVPPHPFKKHIAQMQTKRTRGFFMMAP